MIAMGYLTLGHLDPFEMVRVAGTGGFRASGIRLTGHRPGDAWPFDPADRGHIDRMLAVMRDANVQLVNACTYRFTADTDPADYAPVLEACKALGIGTLICNSFDAEEAATVANLIAVADMAAPLGIRLAVEFIPVSAIRDLGQALRMVQATGRANVGLVIDALHLWRSGGTVADVATADPARLFAVQLCDGPLDAPPDLKAEMRGGRLLPGVGAFDLAGLLAAMPDAAEIEAEVPNGGSSAEWALQVRIATEAFLRSLP